MGKSLSMEQSEHIVFIDMFATLRGYILWHSKWITEVISKITSHSSPKPILIEKLWESSKFYTETEDKQILNDVHRLARHRVDTNHQFIKKKNTISAKCNKLKYSKISYVSKKLREKTSHYLTGCRKHFVPTTELIFLKSKNFVVGIFRSNWRM